MSDKRIAALQEEVSRKGRDLADNKWADYCEGTKGWDRTVLAHILENQAVHLATMDEDTRSNAVASFEKFIFPLIRTVWPNLVSQELVSVQPMNGPVSMLFFLDFTAGTTKGNIKKGDPLITARTGMREEAYDYASETVDLESLTGGVNVASGTLSYTPVRPGSVQVVYTVSGVAYTATDNGVGTLTGPLTFAGTVNYTSGVLSATVVGTTSAVTATYDYNSEGPDFAANNIPLLDASLTTAPVQSRADKIRARWSVEVAAQLRAVHGLEAEQELVEALAQQVRFGIDNKIINKLYGIAAAGSVTFDATPPTGVPYFTHQMALLKTIRSGSNFIFKQTRRGQANWIVAGVDAATIFESHPLFEASGNGSGSGVVFAGTFAKTWKLYKTPFANNVNGSAMGSKNFLLGYKGQNFYDAGFVFAPWIPFYQTPTTVLDDMMFRTACMSHYAIKAVNGLFYCSGLIDHA